MLNPLALTSPKEKYTPNLMRKLLVNLCGTPTPHTNGMCGLNHAFKLSIDGKLRNGFSKFGKPSFSIDEIIALSTKSSAI